MIVTERHITCTRGIPTANISLSSAVHIIFNHWVVSYKLLDIILSDHGQQFSVKLSCEYATILALTHNEDCMSLADEWRSRTLQLDDFDLELYWTLLITCGSGTYLSNHRPTVTVISSISLLISPQFLFFLRDTHWASDKWQSLSTSIDSLETTTAKSLRAHISETWP